MGAYVLGWGVFWAVVALLFQMRGAMILEPIGFLILDMEFHPYVGVLFLYGIKLQEFIISQS